MTWWAPGRVNLMGDHTDYSGGLVLPFAVQLGTTARATARDDGLLVATSTRVREAPRQRRLADLAPRADGWAAYVEGAAWVLLDEGVALGGADVQVDGDLPLGAGLSSSASLVCSALGALLDLAGESWQPQRVALAARRVENDYVGAPVGVMDPMVVMHARAGHALLLDTRSLKHEHVPLPLAQEPPGTGRAARGPVPGAMRLLVVDTGAAHSTAATGYAERVEQCRAAAAVLGVGSLRDVDELADLSRIDDAVLRARARHVVTENRRVLEVARLLRDGQLRAVGPVMLASHESLRADFAVSTPALDLVVSTAVEAGAVGARLTGAGFGGSVVVLVDVDASQAVAEQVTRALRQAHLPAPTIRVASPSAGARRLGAGPGGP